MSKSKSGAALRPNLILSDEAQEWERAILAEHALDAAARLLLKGALEAFDRMRDAQETLRKEGAVAVTSRGTMKLHPAAALERDCRAAMLAAFKALKLQAPQVQPGRAGFGANENTAPAAMTEEQNTEMMERYLARRK